MTKKILTFLAVTLFLLQGFTFAADPSKYSTIEAKSDVPKKIPDFTPPTDTTGPVFPLEDVIGEPNPETNRFLNEFIKMAASLGLILSLIFLAAWFLKRMLNTRQEMANTSSIIKVIERRSLSPKTAVYLLEVEGISILVSESVNGVSHLLNFPSPEDEEEQKPLPSAFTKLLDK